MRPPTTRETRESTPSTGTYEEKVRAIADRIWQMLQKDMRDERERRGKDRS